MPMIRRFLPLLIVLGVGCGVPPADPADLILVGGTVWTGSMDSGSVQAVAVRDGRVQAVGTDREIRALRGPETEVVELEGRMLLPGFIDSHTHFIPGGFQLSSVDLRDAATPQEFARRIGEFARTVEPGSWITGGDWDHEMWGGELPRREWIDSLTPEHPVLVSRLDGHVALANSLALEMAGVTGSTGVPFGGEMVVDPATREPTGILKDEAMGLVGRVIPASTADELDRALDGANPGGWVPEERISLAEALGAYTMGAALAGFAEGKTGSLEVGKYADMVVLSQDLFETDPLEIPAVRVEMTLVGGEIVFRSEG